MLCSVALSRGPGYSGIEIYPAGDQFLYSGKDINDHWKVDLWATTDFEVAFSVGPKVGPFNLGAGLSIGNPDGVDFMYLNLDVGFGFDIGKIHWQSYNLFQFDQADVGNFILLRQWFSFGQTGFGLIGHNIKIADDPFKFHWGPYYDFGPIANSATNKFCVAVDLANNNSIWAAWVVEF